MNISSNDPATQSKTEIWFNSEISIKIDCSSAGDILKRIEKAVTEKIKSGSKFCYKDSNNQLRLSKMGWIEVLKELNVPYAVAESGKKDFTDGNLIE